MSEPLVPSGKQQLSPVLLCPQSPGPPFARSLDFPTAQRLRIHKELALLSLASAVRPDC